MAYSTALFPSSGSIFPSYAPNGEAPKPIIDTFNPVFPKVL